MMNNHRDLQTKRRPTQTAERQTRRHLLAAPPPVRKRARAGRWCLCTITVLLLAWGVNRSAADGSETYDPAGAKIVNDTAPVHDVPAVGEMVPAINTPTLFTITQTGGNPVVAAEHRLDGPFYSWDADPKDPNVDSKISDAVNYPGKLTLTFKGAPKDNKYTRTGTITWHDIPPGAASPQEIKLTATLTLYTLKSVLIPDFNHDRVIEDADRDKLYPAQDSVAPEPFRFWINDDSDAGDVAPDGTDWHRSLGSGKGNASDNKLNGRSDLVDFFPILVDVGDAVRHFPCADEGVAYRLKQADGAVNIVYTSLMAAEAGNFLTKDESTGYGANLDKPAHEAETVAVTAEGIQFPQKFLQQITADGDKKGILLAEVKKKSTAPLVLEIVKGGNVVYSSPMPLSLSNVKEMYRWINIRNAAGGKITDRSNPDEPANHPDKLCNKKMVIYVHSHPTGFEF